MFGIISCKLGVSQNIQIFGSQSLFMQNSTSPSSAEILLHRLLKECQAQLQSFIESGASAGDKDSCVEIVAHASRGNEMALGLLSDLIIPLIRKKCSYDSRFDADDIIQDVSMRLVRRLRNRDNPYQPSTFAAFRSYLNLTIRSVVINTIERDQHPNLSLDQLQDERGSEPSIPSDADAIETHMQLSELLALLPDPLERESLRRRYLYQETPAEIAQALQLEHPDSAKEITKEDVYRYVERGMKRLVNHPLVQKLKTNPN